MTGPGESVLTDLRKQVGDLILSELPPVTAVLGQTVQVCGENPSRLALYAAADDGLPFVIQPYPAAVPVAITRTGVQTTPVVIHAAVYPVLVFLSWHAVATPGVVIRVWEVSRER